MNNRTLSEAQRPAAKGGNFIPALCNVAGTLILLTVIASCLPMTIPRIIGYELYNVVSGSMEPEIPIGSVVYVESVDPVDVQEGDVIAFQSGDSVVVHRALENHSVEGVFVTKGDANEGEDFNDVPYSDLIGRVSRHYPMLGALMEIYTSNVGKVYVVCFAACGAMLNMLAGRLRERRKQHRAK